MKNLRPILIILAICFTSESIAQPVPGKEENIPFLVTFGKKAKKSYGDDDYCQTFFFKVPKDYKKPFYVRVFDPEVGGKNDEKIGEWDTQTKFSIYGGTGAFSNKDARNPDPVGSYRSGNHMMSKTFTTSDKYDNKWYTFGPFNPSEGEYVKEVNGYVIKVIAQGISGNDGNLYRYYLSSSATSNIAIDGGNAFTFEYTVRLYDHEGDISHIYPYIDNNVVSFRLYNFDWDNDGFIQIFSKSKLGRKAKTSNDGDWAKSEHPVVAKEKNACVDLQFIKAKGAPRKRNNVVFYVTNQYGEALPFYAVPIGYTPQMSIIETRKKK